MIRSIHEDIYLQPVNNFNTAIVDGNFPASGGYIDVSELERFAFVVRVGSLNSELTLQVKQDTGATQTADIADVTGATATIAADDDNELVTIEVETRRLGINDGMRYVTLAVSGADGGDDYLDILFVGLNPNDRPVAQPDAYSQAIKVMG